jgi:hypothetical protein
MAPEVSLLFTYLRSSPLFPQHDVVQGSRGVKAGMTGHEVTLRYEEGACQWKGTERRTVPKGFPRMSPWVYPRCPSSAKDRKLDRKTKATTSIARSPGVTRLPSVGALL